MADYEVPRLVARLQDYDRQVLAILREFSTPARKAEGT